ncbi:MAG: UvrB/UvrC motif-containing protein [Methylococcales bacterium]|nr:UvrB/UvrC motif-containing protein [Methylococcales bacterium]
MPPKEKGKRVKQLEKQMYNYAKNLEFEAAGKLRDQLKALENV